jgi:hypothetical protein
MPYELEQWPKRVYPKEMNDECPEATIDIDVLLNRMKEVGPSPLGYDIKVLGQGRAGLWQASLKVKGRQVRILYAPYGNKIVLFRIHKKSSPQEQKHAYDLAVNRKREYERLQAAAERASHGKNRTVH